jgi:hypothetical protein
MLMETNNKIEFGDWQTSLDLALQVCKLLKETGVNPKVIIEPTCGKGNFILAALQIFEDIEDVYGIEIYKPYIDELEKGLQQYYIANSNKSKPTIHLYNQSIFKFDFDEIENDLRDREILVLGNLPWVTNSKLGTIGSDNLPTKTNFKNLGGLDAMTGKSNFDIAESICYQLINFLIGKKAHISLLLKNSVVKNILFRQEKFPISISNIQQYNIDAKREFGASVAACLFYCLVDEKYSKCCGIKDFYTRDKLQKYGWVNEKFVSDVESYKDNLFIDGESQLEWRSGIKHDCSKVMELTFDGSKYVNGYGEMVDIEEDLVYPLLKSSDIKEEIISSTKKYVIVTQQSPSDDTRFIRFKYPKTYSYLLSHSKELDNRASRVYKRRPRFCMFGIGEYSFKPYKIAVSGLYKKINFSIITPINNKSVMVDDTCYILGFDTLEEAKMIQELLNTKQVQEFIKSIVFTDAKRVVNKELLMRIDLLKLIEYLSNLEKQEMQQHYKYLKSNIITTQISLF